MKSKEDTRRTIRAAVLRGAGRPLAIEALDIEGPRDDEVLVRIVASGICHTDIDVCDGGVPGAAVLGHEGAGVVTEVGRAVRAVKPGDHVVLSYQSCGRCAACGDGRPARCRHFWQLNFGFERFDGTSAYRVGGVEGHFFGQSSFATHSLVNERNIVSVDRDLPLELLAPLGCGLQTGAGTVLQSLGMTAGQSLAVFGVGTVGLAAVMAARLVGAEPIIAVDLRPHRLTIARGLGATRALDSRKSDVAGEIARITGGGVDCVVEGTGDAALTRAGIALLNAGGRMALLTGGAGRTLPGDRQVIGVIQGDAVPQTFIPRLIALWRQGKFPYDRLVKIYDFSDINQAIADSKVGKTIKPVLKMAASV
jgi:aryl-alcohol dehydrogenase